MELVTFWEIHVLRKMNGWWWWRWMVTGPASPFLPGWQLSTTTSPTCCSSTQPNPPQPRLPLSPRRRLSISSIFSAGDISPNQKKCTNSRAMFCCQQPISTPSAPTFSPAPLCFLETLGFLLCTTCQLKTSSLFALLPFFLESYRVLDFFPLTPVLGAESSLLLLLFKPRLLSPS